MCDITFDKQNKFKNSHNEGSKTSFQTLITNQLLFVKNYFFMSK